MSVVCKRRKGGATTIVEAGEKGFVASGGWATKPSSSSWLELIQVWLKWFPISQVMGGRGRNRP